MRILFIDIDTLRPDHMGCYGYGRNTTPCMDNIAKEGTVFTNYYAPNAPCLPSRGSLVTGMYGIHSGIVGHGGTTADVRLEGPDRSFSDSISRNNLFQVFRKAGYYTASISTFAERHSSWWFNAGFNETYNMGKGGMESAEEVTPIALDWLERNKDRDNWFLHYHIWDPHTPYRAPEEFGNPFENEELPDNWITKEVFDKHQEHIGPHGTKEINMWGDHTDPKFPRHPGTLDSVDDVKTFMDNYDCGVRYADDNVAKLISLLKEQGIYEDTAIIITSDHGENMGELGIYGEHATADHPCCHIPMVIKWPGMVENHVDNGLHVNIDLAPTMAEVFGVEPYEKWDGKSYLNVLKNKEDQAHPYIVLNQCAHVCQRSVRFEDYIYIRTPHGGGHMMAEEMLFNLKEDPHQQNNLIESHSAIADKCSRLMQTWEYDMMKTSDSDVDPMWTVLREGGPFHAKGFLKDYAERLIATGREDKVEEFVKKYKDYI